MFDADAIRDVTSEDFTIAHQPLTPNRPFFRKFRIWLMTWISTIRDILVALSPSPTWKQFVTAPKYSPGLSWCVTRPLFLLVRATKWGLLATGFRTSESESNSVKVARGDILVLADSTWTETNVWPAVRKFKESGGFVVLLVYDLIPLSHPEYCESSLVTAFSKWIEESQSLVDFYLGISNATAQSLSEYLEHKQIGQRARNFAIGHFHLGSDLDLLEQNGQPGTTAIEIIKKAGATYLVVGSLEPRKNLTFILDGFDKIWKDDPTAKLVIVGHNIWKVAQLVTRIKNHPRLGESLFWLRDATDNDLEFLYQQATALIFMSRIEGFGLPIVEAMQRGLPLICSDIPVFREIADGKATFVSLDVLDELVTAIKEISNSSGSPTRKPHPWLTWRESCDWLLREILNAQRQASVQ